MDTTEDFSSLTVAVLRERLSELGWSTRGLKKDLVERLKDVLKEQENIVVKEEPVEELPMVEERSADAYIQEKIPEPQNRHEQEQFHLHPQHMEPTPEMPHPGVNTLPAPVELTPNNPVKVLIETLQNPEAEYHRDLVTALRQVLSVQETGMNAPLLDASTVIASKKERKEVAIDPKTGHILISRFKRSEKTLDKFERLSEEVKDDVKTGAMVVNDAGSTGTFDASKDQIAFASKVAAASQVSVTERNNKILTMDILGETEISAPAAVTAPTQTTRRSARPRKVVSDDTTQDIDMDKENSICKLTEADFENVTQKIEKLRITAPAPVPIATRRTRKKAVLDDGVGNIISASSVKQEKPVSQQKPGVVIKEEPVDEFPAPFARSRARTIRSGDARRNEEDDYTGINGKETDAVDGVKVKQEVVEKASVRERTVRETRSRSTRNQ
ncbi:hypothetical protein SAICODRAFT_31267 [Saitoella complicata NRRL Y-17804]|uniref:SAP domain-containing protein n=1 Tax=Saitoella complicata (strain BCRC 22490 / CBS 7301 / JCM 7358 / NBRC 10748 / NRRL Y-17804) TaxID=698492 RepID=A0A0E9NQH6_SAICN|nr:uncharacterized protein SAICODRAFT_31267 [Saitoella complicata NRRL Y-17804]ODQ51299.1 hypothetical protein SAICODRAFT_31267 [Saitoella complicata NRRL Y-17804]GAO51680.1 hypothetical protein G7K_5773-t1 [Saitoella complicata NRRL Y-17804]